MGKQKRKKCGVVSIAMGVAGGERCGSAKWAGAGNDLLGSRRKKVPWFPVGPVVGPQGRIDRMLPMKMKGGKG
jgi:hypothetical protein